jgi:hypothetical protein
MSARTTPLPEHVIVGTASNGRELRRKYDALRVGGIPARRMSVVSQGLRWADRVGAEAAAKLGSVAGATLGAAVALVLWASGYVMVGTGVIPVAAVGGAIAGALLALAAQRLVSGRLGLPERAGIEAERFELLVEREKAARAREVLERYGR